VAVLKFLVPMGGAIGFAGFVATLGRRHPVELGAGCFLLFSAMAHHWGAVVLPGNPPAAKRHVREVAVTLGAIAMAAALALAVRGKVAEPYRVLSGSMLPTLELGDEVAGNKLAYAGRGNAPRRGDVVIFESSAVAGMANLGRGRIPDVLVKRVIGVPGDEIAVRSGVPIINGWEVPTCVAGEYLYVLPDGEGGAFRGLAFVEFLEDRAYLTVHAIPMPTFEGSYRVKPGEVFVMGDNRTNSVDSRSYRNGQGGGVPIAAVDAKAQWFLVGTRRGGEVDVSRFLEPLDQLEAHVHCEGINAHDIEAGIARCLANRPAMTHPPVLGEPSAGLPPPPPT
jgi:signal peptidase I